MTRIDQIIADALAGSPETHVAILAREVARLRDARAVVVPELTPDDCLELDEILQEGPPYDDVIPKLAAWICEHFLAIPAGRVLGEGEVAIEICERDCREDDDEALEVLRICGYGQHADMLEVAIKAHEKRAALRANRGGADHD